MAARAFRLNPFARLEESAAADAIQPLTRVGLVALIVLAVANGVYLYVFPRRAATDYAWSIKPAINAAFMGAGYLSGIVAGVLALCYARNWRSARAFIWPFSLLSVVLLVATVVHHDRFRWHFAPTWLWTIIYVAIPPASALLWWRQERVSGPPPPRDARLRSALLVGGALGLLELLLALSMLLRPGTFVAHWPWPLTPLLARAFAGWITIVGSGLVALALMARRASEALITSATLLTWGLLLLPLPLLYHGSVSAGRLAFAVWFALPLSVIAVAGWISVRSVRLMRTDGERL